MCPKPGVPESNKFLQVQVKARLRRMFSPKLINARLELLYEECDNKQCSTNYDCLADTSKYDWLGVRVCDALVGIQFYRAPNEMTNAEIDLMISH